MAIQYTQRGNGITRRPVLTLQGTSCDIRDTLRRAADTRTFEGYIREIEQHARSVLRASGIDPDDRKNFECADDSAEDFCDEILTWIDIACTAIRSGDTDQVARANFKIGGLVQAYTIKQEWEQPALVGAKTLKGSKRGAQALRNKNTERDLAMANEFFEKRGRSSMSDTALKVQIGQRRGLKRTASIEAIDGAFRSAGKSTREPRSAT